MNPARRILQSRLKTIDIQTSQPLRNIAERRCVLNALQKFGEVATFISGIVSVALHGLEMGIKLSAAWLVCQDDDKSKLAAIYETPEAASKAVEASPLTVLLPPHPPSSTHPIRGDIPAHRYEHEHVVNVNINPNTTTTMADHEERISKSPCNNNHTGYTWDKNDPAIKNDMRIADIIAAGAPREVFADGVIDVSYLQRAQSEISKNRMDERIRVVALQGSLVALLEE